MNTRCRIPGQHTDELDWSCRICAGESWSPPPDTPGWRVIIVRTLDECPRGHRGQVDPDRCVQCLGESKNPTGPATKRTPGTDPDPRCCDHGIRIRLRPDGQRQCQLCRLGK